jgi:16S rRNA (guanine966-N2)-methyltransferase
MQKTGPGHVRIIAGTLRGSKLPVLDEAGLRPTADRVRETLFNWLQNRIAGARVLDLFAGSGALGFEAASRGAGQVLCIEQSALAAANLRKQQQRLQVANLQVVQGDALRWLAEADAAKFDMVFLDPPFASPLWPALWQALTPVLAENALIYAEAPVGADCAVPALYRILKQGQTQQSQQLLLQWQKSGID